MVIDFHFKPFCVSSTIQTKTTSDISHMWWRPNEANTAVMVPVQLLGTIDLSDREQGGSVKTWCQH